MSTLKVDALTTKSDNADLTITGGGTGVPNLETGYKVNGTVEKLTGIAPSTSGNVLTSDGTDWTSAAAGGGGKILQVVSAFDDQYRSYSNTQYTSLAEYTQLRCTITPAATSSKVYLSLSLSIGEPYGTPGHGMGFIFKRDSTVIGVGDNTSRNSVEAEVHAWDSQVADWDSTMSHLSGIFVDSPSTTSQIVYSVFVFAGHVGGGSANAVTALVNSGGYNYNNVEQNIGGSQLVAMEIDGS